MKTINDLQENMKSITHQMKTVMMMIQEMNINMMINRNLEQNDDFQYIEIDDSNKGMSIFNQNEIISNPTRCRENTTVIINDKSSVIIIQKVTLRMILISTQF